MDYNEEWVSELHLHHFHHRVSWNKVTGSLSTVAQLLISHNKRYILLLLKYLLQLVFSYCFIITSSRLAALSTCRYS